MLFRKGTDRDVGASGTGGFAGVYRTAQGRRAESAGQALGVIHAVRHQDPRPLLLPERSPVRVTIESGDTEREAWLQLSEKALTKVWDNEADDVFNELLSK